MFDFGDCWYVVLETDLEIDLEKLEISFLCIDWLEVCLGGVKGDDWEETFVAKLAALVRGDGVSGIRPPAVLVEKMP